jgi:hypothetical protein
MTTEDEQNAMKARPVEIDPAPPLDLSVILAREPQLAEIRRHGQQHPTASEEGRARWEGEQKRLHGCDYINVNGERVCAVHGSAPMRKRSRKDARNADRAVRAREQNFFKDEEMNVGQAKRNKTGERDAIKRVVREGEIMVVWLSENGMIQWCPTTQGGCALFAARPSASETVGASRADIIRGCADLVLAVGLPMLVIHGVTGLGATDVGREKWGGDDQRTHDGIWNSNVKKTS